MHKNVGEGNIKRTYPDGYIELNYDCISYDEFIQFMKICIETGLEMPDIVP